MGTNPKEDGVEVCYRLDAAEDLNNELKGVRSKGQRIAIIANWSSRATWKGCRCGCNSRR
jgi:hypothetical protein